MLHCIAVPIAVLSLPLAANSFLASEGMHAALLGIILPTSAVALWLGFRRHREPIVLMTGICAMALLTAASVLFHEAMISRVGETVLTGLGGLLLAAAHWRNFRLSHSPKASQ